MTMNFEVKKDGMRQTQDGLWKLTLTVMPEDMPMELLQAPMGSPYGLAMVPIDYDNPETDVVSQSPTETKEKSEGEKLRIRAVMLCKEDSFQQFAADSYIGITNPNEIHAKNFILQRCRIKSRSELVNNTHAQKMLKELDADYKEWLNPIEEQYTDNFEQYV